MVERRRARRQSAADIVAARRKARRETERRFSVYPHRAVGIPEFPMQKIPTGSKRRLHAASANTYTAAQHQGTGRHTCRALHRLHKSDYAALEGSRKWVKAQQGWRWAEIATGHDAMVMGARRTCPHADRRTSLTVRDNMAALTSYPGCAPRLRTSGHKRRNRTQG